MTLGSSSPNRQKGLPPGETITPQQTATQIIESEKTLAEGTNQGEGGDEDVQMEEANIQLLSPTEGGPSKGKHLTEFC